MTWNEIADIVHKNAADHGFYEDEPDFSRSIVMFHSELSEAIEEYRKGNEILYYTYSRVGNGRNQKKVPKPMGVAVELCDCIIRILDTLRYAGVDIDKEIVAKAANPSLIEVVASCHCHIARAYEGEADGDKDYAYKELMMCIAEITDWLKQQGVDIKELLWKKNEYNTLRPYKHRKKF